MKFYQYLSGVAWDQLSRVREMGDGEEMSKISVRHHSSHWSQISQTSTSMDFSLRDLYFGYKRINFEWETLIS